MPEAVLKVNCVGVLGRKANDQLERFLVQVARLWTQMNNGQVEHAKVRRNYGPLFKFFNAYTRVIELPLFVARIELVR